MKKLFRWVNNLKAEGRGLNKGLSNFMIALSNVRLVGIYVKREKIEVSEKELR